MRKAFVISQKEWEKKRCDEFRQCHWTEHFMVTHYWSFKEGFRWVINCGDFTVCEKKLSDATIAALRLMADDPPVYYRLKEHLFSKGIWKTL